MSNTNLLIIGAGGVGRAAVQKAVQHRSAFGHITLASRTSGKMHAIAEDARRRWGLDTDDRLSGVREVDARDAAAVADLIRDTASGIVLNVTSPYCNPAIMDACLEAGAHYIDTAVSEREGIENMPAPWYAHEDWPRRPAFESAGLHALLGIGFDPGVVNIFAAHAKKHQFDSIDSIDIIDVNGGDHGRYFATNFDPDVNLREVMEDVVYWEDGAFRTIPHHSRQMAVDLPRVGAHTVYSMGHDELHSLPQAIPEARRIEFWMGFGERYLKVFDVLNNLGLLSSVPVDVNGARIAPLQMVKAVLPDPATLAEGYSGEVCIGCDIRGISGGKEKRLFVYSNCDHRACFEEVGSQAISYTTAVPAVTAAMLLAEQIWAPGTMVNAEELDPDPFLALMPDIGIDWHVREMPLDGSWPNDA